MSSYDKIKWPYDAMLKNFRMDSSKHGLDRIINFLVTKQLMGKGIALADVTDDQTLQTVKIRPTTSTNEDIMFSLVCLLLCACFVV